MLERKGFLEQLFEPAYYIFTIEVFGLSFNELLLSFLGAALLLSFIRVLVQK